MNSNGAASNSEEAPIVIPAGALLVTDPDDPAAEAARVVLYLSKGDVVRNGGQIIALVTRSLPRGADIYCNGKRIGKANCCTLAPRVYARVDLEPGVYPEPLATLPPRVDPDPLPDVFHGEPIFPVNEEDAVGYITARNATVALTFKDADFPEKCEGLHIAAIFETEQSLLGRLVRSESEAFLGAVVAEDQSAGIAVLAPLPDVSGTEKISELDIATLIKLSAPPGDPLDNLFGDDDDDDDDEVDKE